MYDTKDINSDYVGISVERAGMKSKLESGEVGDRLRDILEDEEVLDYFNRYLVQRVKMLSNEFLTKNGKIYFNSATQRDSLFESFKLNLETNLLSNAVSFWCRLPGESKLETVMLRILSVQFAKGVIDSLVKAYEDLTDKIKEQELDAFANGSDSYYSGDY